MHVDVVAVAAMEKERTALLELLRNLVKGNGDLNGESTGHSRVKVLKSWVIQGTFINNYEVFELQVQDGVEEITITLAVCPSIGKGPLTAAVSCSKIFFDLIPKLVVLVGIAGCMKNDGEGISLGDVGICQIAYDISAGKFEGGIIHGDWVPINFSQELIRLIRDELGKQVICWPELNGQDGLVEGFGLHYGTFLCSPFVLADSKYKEDLIAKTQDRNLIGIEMEAAGVSAAVDRFGCKNFLMLKGFSDWAGIDKESKNPNKDQWQANSATRSAFLLLSIVEKLGHRITRLTSAMEPLSYFEERISRDTECFASSVRTPPGFWAPYTKSIAKNSALEIRDLKACVEKDLVFETTVDAGNEFLQRARSLYETADRLSAVSIDSVSKFWLASGTKSLARQLIDCQCRRSSTAADSAGKSVFRLFVFETPESAHLHAKRLDHHTKSYPHTYVCSRDHYEQLLQLWAVSNSEIERWLKHDFVLLEYGNGTEYFGSLSEDKITLRHLNASGDNAPILVDKFRDFVLKCNALAAGDLDEVSGVPILRWRTGFWKECNSGSDGWSNSLEELFKQDDTADVFHLFGFHPTEGQCFPDFRDFLAEIKMEIEYSSISNTLTRKHNFKNIRLAKKIVHRNLPIEPYSGGRLRYENEVEASYFIVIKFGDEGSLLRWLNDRDHSRLRFKLFRELIEGCSHLSSAIGNEFQIASEEDFRRLDDSKYQELEKRLGIWRLDIKDDQMLAELVKTEPPGF